MTTTPKICAIEPTIHEGEDCQPKAQTVSTDNREKSSFVKVKKDPWKAMTGTSDVSELVDALNEVEQPSVSYRGPIDFISQSMMINDPMVTAAATPQLEVPDVPDLHGDLLKNLPRLADNLKPIIERYEALIATCDEMIASARASLDYPMTMLEVKALQNQIEALIYRKAEATKSLEEAQVLYDYQVIREEVSES